MFVKILKLSQKRVVIVGFLILIQILWVISTFTKLVDYSRVLNIILLYHFKNKNKL